MITSLPLGAGSTAPAVISPCGTAARAACTCRRSSWTSAPGTSVMP